jgi:Nif-specific regulatory protein
MPTLPPGYTDPVVLARRGDAVVLRAHWRGEPVLLRISSQASLAETTSELAVLAAIDHPGLSKLLDHGESPAGTTWVARRWIDGQDLSTWARGRSQREIGACVARLCPALQALHDHGFAHGDLKAENVIVGAADQPVLCDFGFARAVSRAQGAEPEHDGPYSAPIAGTLYALAPELLRGARPTPESDLFAFGAMLHQLLVGQRAGARDFYARFPATDYFEASRTNPSDLPRWARDIVETLVERDPRRRNTSAARVGLRLSGRLGLAVDPSLQARRPRWRVHEAREEWFADLAETLERDLHAGTQHANVRLLETSAGESATDLISACTAELALRGNFTRVLDLAAESAALAPERLDAWAIELARGGILLAAVDGLDAWGQRVLQHVAATCRQHGQAGSPLVLVGSAEAARPAAPQQALAVPRVELEAVRAFLTRELAPLDVARRDQYARLLLAHSEGTARGLDEALALSEAAGWLISAGDPPYLRPGPLPEQLAAPAPATVASAPARTDERGAGTERVTTLSAAAVAVLSALSIDATLSHTDLAELSELESGRVGAALLALSSAGLVRIQRSGATALHPLRLDRAEARRLHERRAEQMTRAGAPEHERLAQQWLARRDETALDALCEAWHALRERGASELVLAAAAKLEAAVARDPRDAQASDRLPLALRAAVVLGWIGLGDAAHARLELQAWTPVELALAAAERLRGEIALLEGDADESANCFERAARLEPAAAGRAWLGRARALAAAGLWEECEQVARAALPRLSPREVAEARSIAAGAVFRQGRVDAARAELRELVECARADGDAAREAALRQDLGTLERRAGSLAEALVQLEASERLYTQAGMLAGQARARTQLAGLLRECGQLLRAEDLLLRALSLRERLGDRAGAEIARGMLGLCLAERGHVHAALEELGRAADALQGAALRLHGPLLRARILELEARCGRPEREADASLDTTSDPRAWITLARAAWLRGNSERGAALARRAADLAARLGLAPVTAEAEFLLTAWSAAGATEAAARTAVARSTSGATRAGAQSGAQSGAKSSTQSSTQSSAQAGAPSGARSGTQSRARASAQTQPEARVLLDQDRALGQALAAVSEDSNALVAACRALLAAGRDDRAARACAALAARSSLPLERARWAEEGRACLARCNAGLSADETAALRGALLATPDPCPAELSALDDQGLAEDDDMQLLQILEINHRLVGQESLPELLGAIVESAIAVTNAERGFLVLERAGRLVFDTARDSRRGGIDEPELEVSRSVIEQTLAGQRTLRLSNAADDPMLGKAPSVVALELRSILCAPFRVDDGLRGALYVDHRLRSGAFDVRAERLLGLLCDQAALAIAQVRRIEEIRELNEQLGRRVVAQASDLATARVQLARAGMSVPADGLVGSSDALMRVRSLIERAAKAPLPVLVTGPSGSGKELAARALHVLSPRAQGPWIAENCAAFPASLIEAELFGHRRGAFTGADDDRAGLFERANGGTLLLDEIGELPLELQAKLLRVLETGRVRRLGDTQEHPSDFRLVAATNRDLQLEVREGRFREDLYYRINALQITMPALESRLEDLPELVEHFLRFEELRSGLRRKVSSAVLARLGRRRWPGNVRELQNEILRLCVMSRGDIDDPTLVRDAPDLAEATLPTTVQVGGAGPCTLDELERAAILNALQRLRGDKRKAAEELGISRAKVYQRLKDWKALGLLPADFDAN